jgi:flagellar biosynthetic protein FlhB
MAEDSTSRSEKPSAKKYREAREQGRVVRSRDLAMAISALAVIVTVARIGPSMVFQLATRMHEGLSHVGDRPLAALTETGIGGLVISDGRLMLLIVGPLLAVAAISAIAGNVVQSGFTFSTHPLHLDFARLNPVRGLARLAPKQSGIDTVKTIISLIVLVTLAWSAGRQLVVEVPRLPWLSPADAARTGWEHVLRLLWQSALAMLLLSGADYGLQYWRLFSSLKMTKQEVREESKSNEGNPEVKARVRRVQREISRGRMLKAVRTATVVVTNPTHFAVALEYRREKMSAPVVVAKGADFMAARIKAIAREYGVPTVENVSLAQALFKGAEVGEPIPGPLFGAVAEVLAYLVRIKQLML